MSTIANRFLTTAIGPVPVNTLSMVSKSLRIQGWSSGHALDSQEAVEFAQLNGVSAMVEKLPLEKANEAFKAVEDNTVRFRSVLVMQ